VLSVLENRDTLALLPTGGGKSICFQVPGLLLGGTTLVVSPLISLMNDQVQNLRKRGISAVAITSAMNYKEIDIALNNAARGHVQFLYLSPERLQNEQFRQKLSYLPITLMAVDEAHCISQWGYDFRPSYLRIADMRNFFPEVSIIALTASATAPVVKDIARQLAMKEPRVLQQSFARQNLRYVVQLEENKAQRLLRLIHNIGGSGIVYLRNRKKTRELADYLNANHISAKAYHAGLPYNDRHQIQSDWFENKTRVICATNAFGMGIDKPDVRFVVHLDLPDSVEAYFQEAGRAGRDGATAYATIFYTAADHNKLKDNFNLAFPDMDVIKQSYSAICNYYQIAIGAGEGHGVDFDIDSVARSYNLSPITLYNSVKFLEKENYLSLLEAGFEPSKVMVLASKEDIYQFELQYPKFELLIKTLLRSYGGLFESYVFISEKDLAFRVKLSLSAVVEQLQYLHKNELLSYLPHNDFPKLLFTQNRVNQKFLEFSPANYKLLKENHYEKMMAVIQYTSNRSQCRQVQLLRYFSETAAKDCGYCDVCIQQKSGKHQDVSQALKLLLEQSPLTMEAIETAMRAYNHQTWTEILRQLMDEGEVDCAKGLYRLKA
jgi:ATP-dependent DNA helicase RecQ